ncbi:hypothetical protein KDI_52270 [Dictyobacter arantiisoli]|uniref:RNA polymerase sigma factor 70 region 4 type 2 domain-containing protein n=1 Tax=Dictyobacter arantiisoli TaxID=2014874 RepID=A0A5A5TKU2_9CHLR|nr:hypothetical protein KDI_52270 [Dictyobacter arantiisoli]
MLIEVFIGAANNQCLASMSAKEQLTWLRSVAHNKVIDQYRRTYRQPVSSSLDDIADTLFDEDDALPEQVAVRNEKYALLQRYLASLPETQQKILWLRFGQGMSSKEIGEILNKSDTAIRMLLSRTLNFLRNMYAHTDGGKHPDE